MTLATDPTPTFRLTDMIVKEVSIVDRAANKRKFLVIKRSDDMPAGAEVTAQADGTLTAQPTTAAPASASATTPMVEKSDVALTQDAKDTFARILTAAISRLTESKAAVDGAKIVASETEMAADVVCQAIMEVSEALEDTCYALLNVQEPSEEGTEEAQGAAPPEGTPPPAPKPPTPPSPPMGKRYAIIAAKRLVKREETNAKFTTLVAKYGNKMKKERLARFQQAFQVLGSVLGELASDQAAAPTHSDETTAVDETEKAEMVAAVAKAESAAVAASAQVTELQKQVKSLTEQLTSARDTHGGSNAIPIEGDRSRITKDGNFRWPMDMNEPKGRSNVKKGDFFGEE